MKPTLILISLCPLFALVGQAQNIFSTDFAGETGDVQVLTNGSFATAVGNPGTWYRTGNASAFDAAFYNQSRTANWGPPADTDGAALRVGFGSGADFQARVAVGANFDASLDYTLTVRHQTWGRDWRANGAPGALVSSQLNMTLAFWDGAFNNVGNVNATTASETITNGGWTETTFTVTSADLTTAGADGLPILIRLQNNSPSSSDPTTVTTFVDSVTLTAVPEPSHFAAIAGLLALGVIAMRRRRSSM